MKNCFQQGLVTKKLCLEIYDTISNSFTTINMGISFENGTKVNTSKIQSDIIIFMQDSHMIYL